MARPRRSLHRIRIVVLVVSVGFQLPALLWLSRGGARFTWMLAPLPFVVAAALTAPFLVQMLRKPFEDTPKPFWLRAFFLYPFFAWWATSSLFLVLGAIVYGACLLTRTDSSLPLDVTFGVSSLLGLLAVHPAPKLVELELELADLPAAFDGYRVAQISDVHVGSFTPRSRVDTWVARLNATRADLVAITGDLVTSGDDFVDDAAASLSGLDAPDGVFACMGNHDYFCDAERLVRGLTDGGVRVLRNDGVRIERGDATLFVAGIEDNWSGRSDMTRTLRDRAGAPTLLLAHDPNHFPAAARAGVMLQLSGHTHGGQLGLPMKKGKYNLARLITRFTHGAFREAASTLYVSRGAGTTGPPVRLFAPAELTVLTLRSPKA